jgi:hypothetical protein
MRVEEEYQDVLQNIEMAIVVLFKDHPGLSDFHVDSALEALGRTYQREKIGGDAVLPRPGLPQDVYKSVRMVCEWRLGRENMVDEEGQPMSIEPLTVEEIQTCLKRLRKSISTWTKHGGSQGYLKYISQFLG